ncbi:hypothetical protein Enr13x_39260 [Stieleria neptunia]|uniref:Uncharacterized protein n=1 Tax=Stieleria neptunia TaxID=2527979 RepID=A0A518HT79_9BACT|nr:hypothetical protein Enr13x_39260 [Stieleria neptunia]
MGATGLTFVLSAIGVWPTCRLDGQPKGPIRILHLLSLQLIIALIYVYVNSFLPHVGERQHLPLAIGCSIVGTFWWFRVARRTTRVNDPIRVSIYLTSTVLFAYICPVMIVLNAIPLFKRIHPTMTALPTLFVFMTHVLLFLLVFWTTRWFVRLSQTKDKMGEP